MGWGVLTLIREEDTPLRSGDQDTGSGEWQAELSATPVSGTDPSVKAAIPFLPLESVVIEVDHSHVTAGHTGGWV